MKIVLEVLIISLRNWVVPLNFFKIVFKKNLIKIKFSK
jgi:hypothetical protein